MAWELDFGCFIFLFPGCWMKQPFCEQPLFTFFQTKVGISSDASSLVTGVCSQPGSWKGFLIMSEPTWACSALAGTASQKPKPCHWDREETSHHCWAFLFREAKYQALLPANLRPRAGPHSHFQSTYWYPSTQRSSWSVGRNQPKHFRPGLFIPGIWPGFPHSYLCCIVT